MHLHKIYILVDLNCFVAFQNFQQKRTPALYVPNIYFHLKVKIFFGRGCFSVYFYFSNRKSFFNIYTLFFSIYRYTYIQSEKKVDLLMTLKCQWETKQHILE